jgi:hypothetical protein
MVAFTITYHRSYPLKTGPSILNAKP